MTHRLEALRIPGLGVRQMLKMLGVWRRPRALEPGALLQRGVIFRAEEQLIDFVVVQTQNWLNLGQVLLRPGGVVARPRACIRNC